MTVRREPHVDRRKNRDRKNDKRRTRLFNELSVKAMKLLKDESEATYRDRRQSGLLLKINRSGRKQWRCQFYDPRARKMRSIGLGEFKPGFADHVSVKQARDKAGDFRSNKATRLKQEADRLASERGITFKTVAENHLAENVKGKRITADRIAVTLRKVYPVLGDRPFEQITRKEIADLLKKIARERGDRAADITLAALRRMMTKYATDSDTYASPIVKGMARIENPKLRARKRVLDDRELRWLWQTCTDLGTFGALCKMCLLTAQRRGKVANMRFDQIDEHGVWTVPKDDEREKGTGERLLLPPPARQIVAAQEKLRTCAYVFPSSAKTGFSGFGKSKDALDEAMAKLADRDIPHWIIHDLRRSARTLMSRAGVDGRIAEKVMGHKLPGVEPVYDHWGYDPERAEALQKLSDLIGEILQPPTKGSSNVVRLRR